MGPARQGHAAAGQGRCSNFALAPCRSGVPAARGLCESAPAEEPQQSACIRTSTVALLHCESERCVKSLCPIVRSADEAAKPVSRPLRPPWRKRALQSSFRRVERASSTCDNRMRQRGHAIFEFDSKQLQNQFFLLFVGRSRADVEAQG